MNLKDLRKAFDTYGVGGRCGCCLRTRTVLDFRDAGDDFRSTSLCRDCSETADVAQFAGVYLVAERENRRECSCCGRFMTTPCEGARFVRGG